MAHTTKRLFEGHDSIMYSLFTLFKSVRHHRQLVQLQIGLPCFVGKGWHIRIQSLPGSLFPSPKRAWGGGYSIVKDSRTIQAGHGGIIQHHHHQ